MLRVAIVDNEKPVLNLLNILLTENGKVTVVEEFLKPSAALAKIPNLKLDAVFLDIEMPGMNGLELGTKLLEANDELDIIFLTAYDCYAVDAFRVNALDYILKPATQDAINRTVDRIIKNRNKQQVHLSPLRSEKISLFGGIRVIGPRGEAIRWPTAKVEELFAYLILHRRTGINKWTALELLWPEYDPKKAEQNLHTTVFRLKKALSQGNVTCKIENENGQYRLYLHDVTCDLFAFDKFLDKRLDVDAENISEFEHIAEQYFGDLFGDKAYAWCEAERERYQRYFAELVKKAALYRLDQQYFPKAINLVKLLLTNSPYDEEAHELIMRIYCEKKDKVQLTMHFRKMQQLFRDELDLEMSPAVKNTYEKYLNIL